RSSNGIESGVPHNNPLHLLAAGCTALDSREHVPAASKREHSAGERTFPLTHKRRPQMIRTLAHVAGIAALLAVISSASALAGPYGDDLSKCLVSSATDKDKANLVRWVFAATSANPDVSDLVAVSDAQRAEMTRTVGELFERLLTKSCPAQYRDAVKYEGDQT